jgi:hypothetical protein
MDGDIRDGEMRLKDIRDDWGTIGATRGLPTRVSPCDVDAFLELDGHMLLFERDRYGNITNGQLRVLREFSRKPECESWYVPGPKNTFPSLTIYRNGEVAAEYDWSQATTAVQCAYIMLLLADFTRRAGRTPRDGTLP